ncbi:Uncharacterised protein [Listeria newyorkensis]|nr:Uncharacterised protein [Listeria newyorkensis]
MNVNGRLFVHKMVTKKGEKRKIVDMDGHFNMVC